MIEQVSDDKTMYLFRHFNSMCLSKGYLMALNVTEELVLSSEKKLKTTIFKT